MDESCSLINLAGKSFLSQLGPVAITRGGGIYWFLGCVMWRDKGGGKGASWVVLQGEIPPGGLVEEEGKGREWYLGVVLTGVKPGVEVG